MKKLIALSVIMVSIVGTIILPVYSQDIIKAAGNEEQAVWAKEVSTTPVTNVEKREIKFLDSDLYNEIIKFGDNLYITINYNNELATIAAAAGSNFKHKKYLNFDNDASKRIKEYFQQYIGLETAKDIFDICIPESKNENRPLNPSTVWALNIFENPVELNNNSILRNTTPKIKNPADLNRILREFDLSTKATSFMKSNRDLYKGMLTKYKNEYGFNHLSRIDDFFGFDLNNEKFVIYLTLNENGGTSTNVIDKNGTRVNINFINIMVGDDGHILMNVLYHEAIHNFMRVVLDKYRDEIKQIEKYSSVLNKRDWAGFESSVNETVTRAISAIMLEKYHSNLDVDAIVAKEIGNGWKNTDNFYKFIKENYVSNRERYKTFEDFFPEILKYIKELYDNPPLNIQYGIDMDTIDTVYKFGSKEFSATVQIYGPSKGGSGSFAYFKESYLAEKNLIVISGDTNYSRLPAKIRQGISEAEYKRFKTKAYGTFAIGDAKILIINDAPGMK